MPYIGVSLMPLMDYIDGCTNINTPSSLIGFFHAALIKALTHISLHCNVSRVVYQNIVLRSAGERDDVMRYIQRLCCPNYILKVCW